MSRVLTLYNYTAHGAGQVAQLEGKDLVAKELALTEHLRNHPDDFALSLDLFHHLMVHLIQQRQEGETTTQIQLRGEVLDKLLQIMQSQNQFFGYNSGSEFFQVIDEWRPPLFAQETALIKAIGSYFPPRQPEKEEGYDFPESYNEQVDADLQQTANRCEMAFTEILEVLPVMQKSFRIKEQFHAGDLSLTQADLETAKVTFEEYRTQYQKYAKEIASGMPFVHGCFQHYQDNLKVHGIYNQYLAKLLSSREARYPVEGYVLRLAKASFVFEEPSFTVDKEEEYRGITVEQKREEFRKATQVVTNRLESRYKKRKLMAALQSGTPPYKILKKVIQLCETDPDDIKTHIFAARMLAEQGKSMTNPAKRIEYRERALAHCQEAFIRIDTYLDIQGLQDLQERDRVRVGFVKTISGVRNPLIRGS